MKYIIFACGIEGMPIAKKLQDEGQEVIIAQVQSTKNLLMDDELKSYKPEGEEEKKRRLSLYDGIVEKMPAEKVFKKLMAGMKNPEEYFLYFDLNSLFRFAEPLSKLGYNGNFPTLKDRNFEVKREMAKEFVEKNYEGIEIATVMEFSKVDDGIKFLREENEENCIWVLKSRGDSGRTVCPDSDDPELANEQIIDALEEEKKDYESGGFILEMKIVNPIEITPQAVFYDGELVFTDIDIENKSIGSGALSYQTGCSSCLVFPTEIQAEINKIAFPPVVYELAKKHKGMFVWDLSILIDPKTNIMYMGEFCSNRVGYDSIFAEMEMANGAKRYFESLVNKKNPFADDLDIFGTTVRMFNLSQKMYYSEKGSDIRDEQIISKNDDGIWIYDCYKKDDKLVTAGYAFDVAVITGKGQSIEEAAEHAYSRVKNFGLEGVYYRPKFDFLSRRYPSSIINRYKFAKYLF